MCVFTYRRRDHGVKQLKPKDAVAGKLRCWPHRVGTDDPQALIAVLQPDGHGLVLRTLLGAMVRSLCAGEMVNG